MAVNIRNSGALAKWGWILPLVAFGILALRDPAVPGVYMDAVNPDYLAAWLLRGDLVMPAWIYPDNYLAGQFKYPLLNSLYGGNIPAYLGLLFFGLSGFGLEQLRLFHALFGAILLISVYVALRRWRVAPWAALLAVTLLALDPNFVFAWRTQFYLQLVPAIFLFAAIGLLGRDFAQRGMGAGSGWRLWVAGVCLGFAAYCYFIYAFHAAAVVIIYAVTLRRRPSPWRIALPLVFGTMVGWSPYVYAHVSIILDAGFDGYVEMMRGLQSTYGVIDNGQGGALSRMHEVWVRLARLFGGSGIHGQILGTSATSASLTWLHAALLVSGPLIALGGFLSRRRGAVSGPARPGAVFDGETPDMASAAMLVRLMLGLLVAHLVLAFGIGKPLGLQHYIPFVPVVYAALAAGLAWAAGAGPAASHAARSPLLRNAMLITGGAAVMLNVALSGQFMRNLSAHGGAGLYTDAINVAAERLKRRSPDDVLLFPQWGYWMGAVVLMGPHSHVFTSASLKQMEDQLGQDPLLQKSRSFVLVIGKETVKGKEDDVRAALAAFAGATGLQIREITRCAGRNGGEPLWLVEARRI